MTGLWRLATIGHDETAHVNDDVLLVKQAGRFTGPAGTPTSVGIHRAQRQPAIGPLEVPCFFMLNSVVVNRCLRNHEQAIDLDGLLLELFDAHPAGRQVMAIHVGLHQAGIHVHLRRQQPHAQQLVVQAVKDCPETVATDPVDEVADAGVVEHRVIDGQETEPSVGDVFRDG